nr:hypothetical protein GCM10020241_25780 [Streptoalloteichus tenebrarius]
MSSHDQFAVLVARHGAGLAVYGPFPDESEARLAGEWFATSGPQVLVTRSLALWPAGSHHRVRGRRFYWSSSCRTRSRWRSPTSGASGNVSLAVAMLLAAVAGVLLAAIPGSLWIWQLRRRLRR